ncbi:MAG: MmcQ/YjbR family DNA-binding protein [Blastocatellia bacterium]
MVKDRTRASEKQLQRVRRICAAMPEAEEKLSHGEPTFFVRKKVFAMFDNNHHNDGHIAVWVPAPPGIQSMLVESSPKKFFKPPYVGVRGWVGIELDQVGDEELTSHIQEAWRLIAPPKLVQCESEAPVEPPKDRLKGLSPARSNESKSTASRRKR